MHEERMKKTIAQLLKIIQKSSADQSMTAVESVTRGTQRHYVARSPTQLMGEHGELMAREYLEQAGLRYVDGNIASPFGEIDLIMRDGAVWVFVEVKTRCSETFGGAFAAITPHKLTRLRKAIALYIQMHPECARADCRIDAVLVQMAGTVRRIEWLCNIDSD